MRTSRTVLFLLSISILVVPVVGHAANSRDTEIGYRIEGQVNEIRAEVARLQQRGDPSDPASLIPELLAGLERVDSWSSAYLRGREIRTEKQIHFYLHSLRAKLETQKHVQVPLPANQEQGDSNGTISGTITGSDLPAPGGLEGVWVDFFDTSGEWVSSTPTDVDGNYLSPALAEGTYFAKTWNDQAYVDELFDDIACHNICDITTEGQPIVVIASQSTIGVDFDLDPGGTFSGTIRSVVGGAPIEYVIVDIFNTAGEWVSNTSSQADGSYISLGLPAGNYYARTYNDQHYLNELYDDVACPFFCDPIASGGTTIAVVVGEDNAGKDFDLAAGGYISGSITAIGGEPIAEVAVEIFDFQGNFVAWGMTDVDGDYSTNPGMPTGSYFAVTSAPRPFLNEIYDDHYCPSWCDPRSGTEISITTGTEMAGIDFVLTSGGMISGTVRNAAASEGIANIWVEFFDLAGNHVGSALTGMSGDYLSQALPGDVAYFAKTWNDLGYLDELFQEQPCAFGCDITTAGTPIPVIVDSTVLLIDFTLEPGATISGSVTSGMTALAGVFVDFFDPSGNWLCNAITDDGGDYISQALPAGTYYARSWNELGYLNELYDNIPCPNWCEPPDGTAIVAAAGDSMTDIDFNLDLGGLVSGTVVEDPSEAPIEGIFVDIFDMDGNHVSWGDTGSSGAYLTFYALSPGTYYARTWNDLGYADELFDDISCINCDPTQGESFDVIAGLTTSDIDFDLEIGGWISGTVSADGTGSPIQDVHVEIFDSEGSFQTFGVTDGNGEYTIFNPLPAGSYFAKAVAEPPYLSELHDEIACHLGCDVTDGDPVEVVTGATTDLDFELQTGGFVAGEVSDTVGAGLEDIHIEIRDTAGFLLTWEPTDPAGIYTTSQVVPPGTYFVSTWNDQGYVNEIYDDLDCLGCDVTVGKKVIIASGATTAGIDFELVAGGHIAGTVTEEGTGEAIPRVRINVYTQGGTLLQRVLPNDDGEYLTSMGLPSGSYYVATTTMWGAGPRYVNEIFDDLPCPGECDVTIGMPVLVGAGGTTSDIDFELALGGQISGTVLEAGTNAPIDSSEVLLFDSAGNFMDTTRVGSSGAFTSFRGVPTGTYFAATKNFDGYLDELYKEAACHGGGDLCAVTSGTPIPITAGSVTEGIEFTLSKTGGWIAGAVTEAVWGHGLPTVNVDIFDASGDRVTRVLWNRPNPADGSYKTCGLPAGTYFAKVDASPLIQSYANQAFDDLDCVLGCDVTQGTPITVHDGVGTLDIDFALVPLIFADGFESMDMTAWTTTYP